MQAPSILEENRWPNLDSVDREIAEVRRQQLLLQDKLRQQRSLCGAVGSRVKALLSGTSYDEQLRDTGERLRREESRLRRAKLQFILENKVSNLPILHSNAQAGRRPHEEREDTVATTASYTWSARSSRSSAVRSSGSAEARGRFGKGANGAREDDGHGRSAAQPSAKITGGSWYAKPPAVAPEASDAFVPRDGTGWLQRMLTGGFRRKTRQAVAPSPTTGRRDSLEARSSGRHTEGARHGPAEATSALPPAPAPTTGATKKGREVNADGAAREPGATVIPKATTAHRRGAATVDIPQLPRPVSVDSGKRMDNTLEQMHNFLNNCFALLETQNGSACRRKSLVLAAAAAESRMGAPTVGTGIPPPSVWVKHYLDESSKYGLGFALADGSIGVRLNCGRSIVLDSAGVAFDYVEHARRSSCQDNVGGLGGTKGKLARKTYTLENFPRGLKKNVNLLHSVRSRLRQGAHHGNGAAPAQPPAEDGTRNEESTARGQTTRQPLVFVKKFRRTKRTLLFQLSNGTVQVLFGDHTEILLSEGARLITYVGKDGKRETFTCRTVLDERRMDVRKRLRHSNYLIASVLGRT